MDVARHLKIITSDNNFECVRQGGHVQSVKEEVFETGHDVIKKRTVLILSSTFLPMMILTW